MLVLITHRFYNASYHEVKIGVRVMAILYKANRISKVASMKDFYNDAINQELENDESSDEFNLVSEYRKWRRDKPRSIISYPFVLDPSNKVGG